MTVKIFPAVDILGGQCVQLVQGRKESSRRYGDPLKCASGWIEEGADCLHIINLDGAFGDAGKNAGIIREIIDETGVFIQLGGGIRSITDASGWLNTGVDRVIIGTMAVKEPETVRTLADEWGSERICAGVDAKDGQVVVKGWEESAGDYLSWAEKFEELGAGSLLYTNVDVEGLERGISSEPVRDLISKTKIPVIASGGVTSTEDVKVLYDMGAGGVVLGSALYSGKINFKDALEVIR